MNTIKKYKERMSDILFHTELNNRNAGLKSLPLDNERMIKMEF